MYFLESNHLQSYNHCPEQIQPIGGGTAPDMKRLSTEYCDEHNALPNYLEPYFPQSNAFLTSVYNNVFTYAHIWYPLHLVFL